LTSLQLDSGRGIGSNLCPLQATWAGASLANVIDARPKIESESNIDNAIPQRMIVSPGLRDIRGGAGECSFAARMSHLNCHVVANRNLTSWPWPAFSALLVEGDTGITCVDGPGRLLAAHSHR
jgi:hypothetical protein